VEVNLPDSHVSFLGKVLFHLNSRRVNATILTASDMNVMLFIVYNHPNLISRSMKNLLLLFPFQIITEGAKDGISCGNSLADQAFFDSLSSNTAQTNAAAKSSNQVCLHFFQAQWGRGRFC